MRLLFPGEILLDSLFGTRVGQLLQLLTLTLFSLWWHGIRLAGFSDSATFAIGSFAVLLIYPISLVLLANDKQLRLQYGLLLFVITLIPAITLGGMLVIGAQQDVAIGTASLVGLLVTALQFPLTMYAVVAASSTTPA